MTTNRKVTQVTAREYLRVSVDRTGNQRSVAEQHEDNSQAATDHGLTLGDPYADDGVPASRYTTKVRGDFGRLMDDLTRDTFAADVLIMWESSRGSRRVGEWVALLDLLEARAVRVLVTTHGRLYDPANPRDRRSLLEDAVDSEYESAKIRTRVKRAMAASAAAGRPHGIPPTGYQRVFDQRTGRLIGWEPNPDEAPQIVEMFDRLRAGDSFHAIARDWEPRGIVNRSGRPYTPEALSALARRNPAFIGKRIHNGELLPGTWPAIVDEETWNVVQRILEEPSRKTARNGRAVHELSIILRCDVCGGPLAVTKRRDRAGRPTGTERYQCNKGGHVKVDKAPVDEIVVGAMLAYLSRPENAEQLAEASGNGERLVEVRTELSEVRRRLDELHDAVAAGSVSVMALSRAEPQLLARVGELETEERSLAAPPRLPDLLEPGADMAARWKAAPLTVRREVARLLLSPGMLGEVRVTRGRGVPAADRIVWRRW